MCRCMGHDEDRNHGTKRGTKMKKARGQSQTAADVFDAADLAQLSGYISRTLHKGGAVMIGQTRNQDTLIVTTYLDGDQDKSYYETAAELDRDCEADSV